MKPKLCATFAADNGKKGLPPERRAARKKTK